METQQLEILIGGYHVSKRLNKSDATVMLERKILQVARGLDLCQRRLIQARLRMGKGASQEEVERLRQTPQILRKMKQRYNTYQSERSVAECVKAAPTEEIDPDDFISSDDSKLNTPQRENLKARLNQDFENHQQSLHGASESDMSVREANRGNPFLRRSLNAEIKPLNYQIGYSKLFSSKPTHKSQFLRD